LMEARERRLMVERFQKPLGEQSSFAIQKIALVDPSHKPLIISDSFAVRFTLPVLIAF